MRIQDLQLLLKYLTCVYNIGYIFKNFLDFFLFLKEIAFCVIKEPWIEVVILFLFTFCF